MFEIEFFEDKMLCFVWFFLFDLEFLMISGICVVIIVVLFVIYVVV